jgi:hypothetical protein
MNKNKDESGVRGMNGREETYPLYLKARQALYYNVTFGAFAQPLLQGKAISIKTLSVCL